MDLGLAGKRAIVTASSQGLGLAIAKELLREGCQVVLSSRRQEALDRAADTVCAALGISRHNVHTCAADVTQPQAIRHLVGYAKERLGGIDILVTNAGGPPPAQFEDTSDEMWMDAVQLNLMSVVRLIRETLPHMRAQGAGRILNVSSTSIKQPIPDLILSNTVRTAVMSLLKSLSIELAEHNILVHNLAPGRFLTERVQSLDKNRAERTGRDVESVRKEQESKIPLGRYGTPEEFGKYAAFLVSDANQYTTGDTVYLDGGVIRTL